MQPNVFIINTALKVIISAKTEKSVQQQQKKKATSPENIVSLLQVDPMELEIGYSLIPLVDTGQGGDLLGSGAGAIKDPRRQIAGRGRQRRG